MIHWLSRPSAHLRRLSLLFLLVAISQAVPFFPAVQKTDFTRRMDWYVLAHAIYLPAELYHAGLRSPRRTDIPPHTPARVIFNVALRVGLPCAPYLHILHCVGHPDDCITLSVRGGMSFLH
ncbi:hypothetical protein B0H16DRAFT_898418 [Mycena metata]|uniref:Uncharacterized protein n=1 Tax=Mycena metata TaxID=1033252 RepID=A0AAD7IRG2_9AGAR|nr:hypothetical protein B0H16DRAFT_898418 [Mycena metata]